MSERQRSRLPDAATSLLASCRQEGSATPEMRRLVELMMKRAKELAGTYGSEVMQPAEESLPGL